MSTPAWALPALTAVLERVAAVRSDVGDRFPLFAEPGSGHWTTTGRGSWTGGFWAGLLWLRALGTGEALDRAAAAQCTARLAPWAEADTATRGLIFWYGTALAADDDRAAELRARAARACLDSYDHELGLVPWGSAFGGPRLLARADASPGLVPLLATAGPEAMRAAGSHLRTHLELCLTGGTSRFDPGSGWLPFDDPPAGWSRGRAWLQLAAADAVHHLGAEELGCMPGQSAASRLVPLADESRPDGPCDTSAAAITAVALLKLGHRERAVAVLEELVRVHLTGSGRLLDGCYDLGREAAVRHELVWGTFFLAYGLAVLTGLVDVHAA
ncbi:sugar ABC transporter permease [Streptomyces sp. NBC_01142]|uniref:sugar ABC transporter permease n=1 Tax=Streptomyces sp. NBC_01142 TaxID=2975865 RepID=UPI00225BF8F5|nr:sugar ABC transporter permease [Streptomyces sp. NBC_01142]MCX4820495.1 sugar ABC transporter permease [Streptomyces sp. NBC_01142]